MKLLIVEDNATMRRTIRSIISNLADEIYECSDGNSAVSLYCQCQPDWVLMDINLKGIDGIVATANIKALYPEAKIVIVTSYDSSKLKEAALKAGASHYLLKNSLFEINDILISNEDIQIDTQLMDDPENR